MKTIKFTAAKTESAKQAIHLIDMYKAKSDLSSIKEQAKLFGIELVGRSFKSVYPQLVAFYEMAMIEEEAQALEVA